MRNNEKQILLGTRIPARLKDRLSRYCLNHGVKINYIVTQAIREKLQGIFEDESDGFENL